MNTTELADDASQQPEQPALAAANEALAQMRLSFDSSLGARSPSPSPAHVNGFMDKDVAVNGHRDGGRDPEKMTLEHGEDHSDSGSPVDTVQWFKLELLRTKQENETLTTKYNTLVTKLATMRSSVESKLKRDAVSSSVFFRVF